MRPIQILALLFSGLLAACSGDDEGDRPADAATTDAPAGGADAADAAEARSISFEVQPTTVHIQDGTVEPFQLTGIATTGVSLTNGLHYHIFLDSSEGDWLIYSEDVPTSPEVEIPAETPAGAHMVVVTIEDRTHEPIGVEASRPLEVVAGP